MKVTDKYELAEFVVKNEIKRLYLRMKDDSNDRIAVDYDHVETLAIHLSSLDIRSYRLPDIGNFAIVWLTPDDFTRLQLAAAVVTARKMFQADAAAEASYLEATIGGHNDHH